MIFAVRGKEERKPTSRGVAPQGRPLAETRKTGLRPTVGGPTVIHQRRVLPGCPDSGTRVGGRGFFGRERACMRTCRLPRSKAHLRRLTFRTRSASAWTLAGVILLAAGMAVPASAAHVTPWGTYSNAWGVVASGVVTQGLWAADMHTNSFALGDIGGATGIGYVRGIVRVPEGYPTPTIPDVLCYPPAGATACAWAKAFAPNDLGAQVVVMAVPIFHYEPDTDRTWADTSNVFAHAFATLWETFTFRGARPGQKASLGLHRVLYHTGLPNLGPGFTPGLGYEFRIGFFAATTNSTIYSAEVSWLPGQLPALPDLRVPADQDPVFFATMVSASASAEAWWMNRWEPYSGRPASLYAIVDPAGWLTDSSSRRGRPRVQSSARV